VDLSQVEFFGSNALAVLVDTHQRATAEDRTFVLIAETRIVRRPLKVTELDKVLSVYDDLDHALEAVHAGSARPTTMP
jgi:anti-sigma B factor antagonist